MIMAFIFFIFAYAVAVHVGFQIFYQSESWRRLRERVEGDLTGPPEKVALLDRIIHWGYFNPGWFTGILVTLMISIFVLFLVGWIVLFGFSASNLIQPTINRF